jgi:elongation factor P--(R)-beta-lysine ligase
MDDRQRSARNALADWRPFLIGRARVVAALRAWFAAQGFVEVETSILQVSPGNETHLHAFATDLVALGGGSARRYLRTSPEFACKKLISAGEQRIVEFARVFRNRERGALHAPEFTMLEWYRADAPYQTLMEDCAAVLAVAAEAAGTREFAFRGRAIDPFAAPERLTVAQAFTRKAAIDLSACLSPQGPDRGRFAAAAKAAGIRLPDDDSWGDIFSRVLVERIEPRLGLGRATVLDAYPAALSALARPCAHDPRWAERFELYACGIELANAFGELTDPVEQRARLAAEMAEKERIYGERYPLDEEFLAALSAMPPTCGIALGLDRLVMLATGASHIDQVLWTRVAEP